MKTKLKTKLAMKDKIQIFFFGMVWVVVFRYQYFYNLPGTEKDKRKFIRLYYGGIVFWALFVIAVIYIISKM